MSKIHIIKQKFSARFRIYLKIRILLNKQYLDNFEYHNKRFGLKLSQILMTLKSNKTKLTKVHKIKQKFHNSETMIRRILTTLSAILTVLVVSCQRFFLLSLNSNKIILTISTECYI